MKIKIGDNKISSKCKLCNVDVNTQEARYFLSGSWYCYKCYKMIKNEREKYE